MRKFLLLLPILTLTLAAPIAAQNPDPCPKAERQFAASRSNAERSASSYRAKIESVKFDEAAFEKAVKAQLVAQMKVDLKDTIDAFNAQTIEDCKNACKEPYKTSDKFLTGIAEKKVAAAWLRPATQKNYAETLEKAKTAFADSKAQALAKFDADHAVMKAGFDQEEGKLRENCNYGFLPTLVRIVGVLLTTDIRVQNGMLKVGDFKTYVPEVFGGKVMLGNHHVFNIPEVKGQNVEIGGTVVFTAPQVVEGGKMIEWGNFKTDIVPQVDVKFNQGHGGFGVSIGSWKF